MKIQVQSPSHVCPRCGEWWTVELIDQDAWRVLRYSDHTRCWTELVPEPVCPHCKRVVLKLWLIDDD